MVYWRIGGTWKKKNKYTDMIWHEKYISAYKFLFSKLHPRWYELFTYELFIRGVSILQYTLYTNYAPNSSLQNAIFVMFLLW